MFVRYLLGQIVILVFWSSIDKAVFLLVSNFESLAQYDIDSNDVLDQNVSRTDIFRSR